ncbi:unnamed protein product, partial [marine sediment metagenome]
ALQRLADAPARERMAQAAGRLARAGAAASVADWMIG